jgi:hypothetical protein
MADDGTASVVLQALLDELSAQGQAGMGSRDPDRLASYPIKGTIDVVALAEAVETALGGSAADGEGKSPAELNAANDG